MFHRWCMLSFLLLRAGALWGAELPVAATGAVHFARDIEPLLGRSCLGCHGPEKQRGGYRLDSREAALRGGETHSPAIKPGDSAGSPLIQMVAGVIPDQVMPQKGDRLTPAEIGLLRAWIDQGAGWKPGGGGEASSSGRSHWSFQPVRRPPVAPGFENPIDGFIGVRLAEAGLGFSPEADRRTLIRRVSFDLVGLPPTPEEVEAFEADAGPRAYERLVDRLLASPRFGERWARHWLDVVRFAESNGFEMNQVRPNAWPYRDYVIRSFNEDKPYDLFIREQLAGDGLGAGEATGFLVGGSWDQVKSPDPVLTANQRADELHDMVNATGTAFLGLTVGCARCHSHKFDPIPQADYYALRACLEGVQHGERAWERGGEEGGSRRERLAEARARLARIESELDELEPLAGSGPPRALVSARRNVERLHPTAARRVRFTVLATSGGEPCLDELEVYDIRGTNVALAAAGTRARASSVFPNSEIHRVEHVNDGMHGNSRSWISSEPGKGWVELEFPDTVSIVRIVWGRDREQKYADRLATDYRIEVSLGDDVWRLVASATDRGRGAAGEGGASEDSGANARRKELLAEQRRWEARVKEALSAPMVYAGRFEEPKPTHRLHRGDPMQPREQVPPGGLSEIGLRWQLGEQASEQERRKALADWVASSDNPLTARVMANRLWHYHFGRGLVATPSDLGMNGGRPSHPELLDWLASELVTSGWRLKRLHRLICTSATYRQSGRPRPEAMAVDAESRFLWRFPPRRLEAEALRDAMLAVSGCLDFRMGGPGFDLFEPNDNYVKVYRSKLEPGADTWRRMIYQSKPRMQLENVFGAFDCPDAGQVAPRRTSSTTPLQALSLLNSPFVLGQASRLASRLEREAGGDPERQVERGFRLAFGRPPSGLERGAGVRLVTGYGLAAFCRGLFNANEFVRVD